MSRGALASGGPQLATALRCDPALQVAPPAPPSAAAMPAPRSRSATSGCSAGRSRGEFSGAARLGACGVSAIDPLSVTHPSAEPAKPAPCRCSNGYGERAPFGSCGLRHQDLPPDTINGVRAWPPAPLLPGLGLRLPALPLAAPVTSTLPLPWPSHWPRVLPRVLGPRHRQHRRCTWPDLHCPLHQRLRAARAWRRQRRGGNRWRRGRRHCRGAAGGRWACGLGCAAGSWAEA